MHNGIGGGVKRLCSMRGQDEGSDREYEGWGEEV